MRGIISTPKWNDMRWKKERERKSRKKIGRCYVMH